MQPLIGIRAGIFYTSRNGNDSLCPSALQISNVLATFLLLQFAQQIITDNIYFANQWHGIDTELRYRNFSVPH